MPDWSLIEGQRYAQNGTSTANSRGTDIAASASANTKGSWTQLIASTAFPIDWALFQVDFIGGSQDQLTDIGVGGAGSETVIAANLYCGSGSANPCTTGYYYLPIHIPAGTRIAARTQATSGSNIVRVQMLGMQSGINQNTTLGRIVTYGANTADSGGTSIDPGGSANTKGSWTQITSSTTNPISALAMAIGNQQNAARTDANWLIDVGIGAGGSEVVLIPDIWVQANTADDQLAPQSMTFPVSIPAGTRIAVRAQCSITDATDRLFDILLYGAD